MKNKDFLIYTWIYTWKVLNLKIYYNWNWHSRIKGFACDIVH